MNRTVIAIAMAGCTMLATSGQSAPPAPGATPARNPHVYSDPAMRVQVPDDFRLLGMRQLDPSTLDGQQVVAVWTKGKDDARETIVIAVEPFSGFDLDAYETQAANDARQGGEGVLVDKKVRTATANKMPAYWLAIAMGSGFNAMRRYEYIWTDGVRGVTVAISSELGQMTEDQAKAALANIYATSYPTNRSQ